MYGVTQVTLHLQTEEFGGQKAGKLRLTPGVLWGLSRKVGKPEETSHAQDSGEM